MNCSLFNEPVYHHGEEKETNSVNIGKCQGICNVLVKYATVTAAGKRKPPNLCPAIWKSRAIPAMMAIELARTNHHRDMSTLDDIHPTGERRTVAPGEYK